ncbi:hypothetical protein CR513_05819, partial [Mucuna pruriens]
MRVKDSKHFTPLTEKQARILKEIYHTSLLEFPPVARGRIMGSSREDWCEFHRTASHSTEGWWTLKTQIEKLVQEGRLNQYVRRRTDSEQGGEGSRGHDKERPEVQRKRSRSKQRAPTHHRGTIATISGEQTQNGEKEVHMVLTGANLTPLGRRKSNPVITFDDRDLRHGIPGCDEPMVVSVIATEYKIERVLIDQGSSANILYWLTPRKMGLKNMTDCQGMLYGFAGERVSIKGTIELETTFGDGSGVKTIPVVYTVVDAETSYNIIMGRLTLNRLGAVVSTYHLCMKFPVGQGVAIVRTDTGMARRCYEDSLRVEATTKPVVNVLDLDLDPGHFHREERPHPAKNLKEVQIGPLSTQVTRIGTTLSPKEETRLVNSLKQNVDTTREMPVIDPKFMCHRLSVTPKAKPVAQKTKRQGEEKRRAIKEETGKLLAASFVWEVQYPTWLTNVVMVKKANGQ